MTFSDAIAAAEQAGPQYIAVWPDSAEPKDWDAPYEGRVFAANRHNGAILGEIRPDGGLDVSLKGLHRSHVD